MSTDEIIDKNKGKIKMLLVFALIFSLGFACGFYYIDAEKSEAAVTIRDKSADCSALFEKSPNVAVATGAATDSVLTGETAQQTVGAVLSASDTKTAPGSSAAEKRFVGSKNSTLYHTPDCQYVKRVKAENLVTFGSAAEAEAAGKKPHSCVGG